MQAVAAHVMPLTTVYIYKYKILSVAPHFALCKSSEQKIKIEIEIAISICKFEIHFDIDSYIDIHNIRYYIHNIYYAEKSASV